MGHAKPEDLKDVQHILNEIRKWKHIKEKSSNVFYFKSKPFLHFHEKDGERWADVRDGNEWGEPLNLPFQSSRTQFQSFLREVKKRYQIQKK